METITESEEDIELKGRIMTKAVKRPRENSNVSSKKNSQLANALNSNVLSEQMSRIEAKVDDLQTVMKLIQQ